MGGGGVGWSRLTPFTCVIIKLASGVVNLLTIPPTTSGFATASVVTTDCMTSLGC